MRLVESSPTKLEKRSPTCLAGEFASFDTLNQNGRIYPQQIYEDALKSLYPKVESRSLLGECDHPIEYDEVRLSNVSHVITKLECREGKVFGEVELLDTPAGKVVQSLVEAGVPIGISSRALGDAIEENGHEKVTDMQLITYDLVADPSFQTAVLNEVSKSQLGESLKKIEKKLPMNESKSSSPVRRMIKSIRESLLSDSSKRVSIDTRDMEISSLKTILESKTTEVVDLKGKLREMSSSLKSSSTTLKDVRRELSESRSSLNGLRTNMMKLQDSYNSLMESTVSKTEYEDLESELIELRKKYLVESRGLTYSQVRDFLKEATTEKEITTILDSLSKHRQSRQNVVTDLDEMSNKFRKDESRSKKDVSRLTNVISRI